MAADDPWIAPKVHIEVAADLTPEQEKGFLRLRRWELRVHREGGKVSEPFHYDAVEREATDAVVLLLYHEPSQQVCLRSSLRPPLAFRSALKVPMEPAPEPVLWELPAGLIEPSEVGLEGLLRCAARETMEETGFDLPVESFTMLGEPLYLSPGVIAERIYFFRAEVDPAQRGAPTEDGTPVEADAYVRFFDLDDALEGRVGDAKSELGIWRLRRHLAKAAIDSLRPSSEPEP